MSVLPKSSAAMTVGSFLEWSERHAGDTRYELLDGVVYAMSPERLVHADTKYEVTRQFKAGILAAGLQCQAVIDGMAVRIDDRTVFEPDSLVRRGPPPPDDAVVILDPVIVVEVTSPSTQRVDALTKLSGYFRNPSIRHYLIVMPATRTVLHHRRDGERIETGIWTSGAIRLDPPGLVLDVSELFPPPADHIDE